MKSICIILVVVFFGESAFGQADTINSTIKKKKYSFGGVPILSFDADIGLRYGALANMYRYNDSSSNPFCYTENLFLRVFNTTKNSFQIQSVYETNNLFPKSKVFLEGTYLNDKSYDFYGFNGIGSRYEKAYEDKTSPEFLASDFYSVHRQLLRFRFDYQRYLRSENIRLLTGVSYQQYRFSSLDMHKSLYGKYVNMGLIPESESKGGRITTFSLGIVYDRRDNQCYCSDGQWFESFLVLSPKVVSDLGFIKHVLTYRTYKELFNSKFVFMGRVSFQTLISGKLPSYLLTNYYDTKLNQDGIGGAFTLRGVNRNRIAADGFGLINLELRRNLFDFKVKKTKMNVDLSVFSDNSIVTQRHFYDEVEIMPEYQLKFFNSNYSPYFGTVGSGLYLILNKNNVISINYGLPINHKESSGGLYIGSSFLF